MLPSLNAIASRLRFRHLALVIGLSEHGSLNRAAEFLGMTQSGLTKALQEIEATFGAPLFVRSARGLLPNALGHCVIRYARLARSDLGHLHDDLAGAMRGSGGKVVVGAIPGALHSILVAAVIELQKIESSIFVSLREGSSSELLEQVDQGRIDLALCRTTVAQRPDQFDYEFLSGESVCIVVNPSHPLVGQHDVTWTTLTQHRWIVYPAHLPVYGLMERTFASQGLPMPPQAIETSSPFSTLLLLQEDSDLIALMSGSTAKFCEIHGIVRKLPLEMPIKHEGYGIVTRHGAHITPAMKRLFEVLRSIASSQQALE
jgi:DNA-binding transcriptional LysR family regulator